MKIGILILAFLYMLSSQAQKVITLSGQPDLIPEGIAISPAGNLYISSYFKRNILEYRPQSGQLRNFIESEEQGFLHGTGMTVKNGLLFALSGEIRGDKARSALHVFDLNSGELLHNYSLEDSENSFMNDLAVSDSLMVYITDTKGHRVLRLHYPKGELEVFLSGEEIQHPNGIAISEEGSTLFVDSWSHGIRIIDLRTSRILNTRHAPTSGIGIDGLKYHGGALYAIRNGGDNAASHGLIKIPLLEDESALGEPVNLLTGHPKMEIPTTFCILGDTAYILANSQLEDLDQEENRIVNPSKLSDTYILEYPLGNGP